MFDNRQVIGYFAFLSPAQVMCTGGDACVVAGSEEAMRSHLQEELGARAGQATVRKVRFGEVLRGIELGGAYAFDEAAYAKFRPLAVRHGLAAAGVKP
jgi:hypothetical protein